MHQLMFHENAGFHPIPECDVEQAKKDGWVDGAPLRAARKVAAKNVANVVVSDTITAQPVVRKAGRPRKEVPSILNDGGEDGNSPNPD